MWYWYARDYKEILIDLDGATPKRLAVFAGRLAGATKEGQLRLDRWFFLPSQGAGNLHAVLIEQRSMSHFEAAAWELYLLSDRHRAVMGLFRAANGYQWPSLLIEPYEVPGWRKPDAVCDCVSKHDAVQVKRCQVMKELSRPDAEYFVGKPDRDHWRETLARGILA